MQDIQSWLAELGLERYLPAFTKAEIDFETLADLEADDLKDLGLLFGAAPQNLGRYKTAHRTLNYACARPG